MKNIKRVLFLSIFFIIFILSVIPIKADWWGRDENRPTQPAIPRDIIFPTNPPAAEPTSAPTVIPTNQVQPTTAPVNPTATPRIGEPTGVVSTPTPTGVSSTSGENPCDPGKPFTGPYCGWSPDVNAGSGGREGRSAPRIGGASYVKGLSYTSGPEIGLSDIILLIGVLCLAMYAKSKWSARMST